MFRRTLVTLTALGLPAQDAAPPDVVPLAQLASPELREVSGLARSREEGVFWTLNDSGDEARIFAVRESGEVVAEVALEGAENVDWEAMASSDGTLYVADVGNNANERQDLCVYELEEPAFEDGTVAVRRRIEVAYPDQSSFPAEQWHFDCEAVFIDAGKLYFLTKHRRAGSLLAFEGGTKLYRLDLEAEDAVLEKVSESGELSLVTGAELGPDGSRLALVTYTAVFLLQRPAEGDDWLAPERTRIALNPLVTRTVESIAWREDGTLLLANEQGALFMLTP